MNLGTTAQVTNTFNRVINQLNSSSSAKLNLINANQLDTDGNNQVSKAEYDAFATNIFRSLTTQPQALQQWSMILNQVSSDLKSNNMVPNTARAGNTNQVGANSTNTAQPAGSSAKKSDYENYIDSIRQTVIKSNQPMILTESSFTDEAKKHFELAKKDTDPQKKAQNEAIAHTFTEYSKNLKDKASLVLTNGAMINAKGKLGLVELGNKSTANEKVPYYNNQTQAQLLNNFKAAYKKASGKELNLDDNTRIVMNEDKNKKIYYQVVRSDGKGVNRSTQISNRFSLPDLMAGKPLNNGAIKINSHGAKKGTGTIGLDTGNIAIHHTQPKPAAPTQVATQPAPQQNVPVNPAQVPQQSVAGGVSQVPNQRSAMTQPGQYPLGTAVYNDVSDIYHLSLGSQLDLRDNQLVHQYVFTNNNAHITMNVLNSEGYTADANSIANSLKELQYMNYNRNAMPSARITFKSKVVSPDKMRQLINKHRAAYMSSST
jgi:hypothetical protein